MHNRKPPPSLAFLAESESLCPVLRSQSVRIKISIQGQYGVILISVIDNKADREREREREVKRKRCYVSFLCLGICVNKKLEPRGQLL